MTRRLVNVLVVASSAIALGACSNLSASTSNDISGGDSEAPEVISATTNIDSVKTLGAGERIQVNAQDPWTLESVEVNGPGGQKIVPLTAPATTWKSDPLEPQQLTTVTASLRNPVSGDTQKITRDVLAGPATNTYTATLFPKGGTYGVGIIPTVTFSKDVPVKDRASLTQRLKVVSTPTQVTGGWRWLDSTTVAFRPAKFWPAKTKVAVTADIKNVRISGSGKVGAWGANNKTASFKTGRSMIVNINSGTVSGNVVLDGKVVRRFGVSTGKSGYTTRSGIKTITYKAEVQRMTNVGVTDDEVYDLQVPLAMRITDSGEFLHAAPWNGNIGYANTSHGCTNLQYGDAEWIFRRAQWGDPVVTTGTGRQMETDNGPGAMWNIKANRWARVKTG